MAKIALIGAGGVIFTRKLLVDLFLTEGLRDSEISLMDIDAGRLKNACIFTEKSSTNPTLKCDITRLQI